MNKIINSNSFEYFKFIFLSIFLFLPSINFNIYEAEIFPYGVILALLYINSFSLYHIFFLIILIFSGLLTFLYIDSSTNFYHFFRIIGAYINPIFAAWFVFKINREKFEILYRIGIIIFLALFLLGIIQLLSFIPNSFDYYINLLVPRSSFSSLGERGVTLLSTEPARASVEFIFLYLLIRYKYSNYVYDIIIILYILLIFKSVTGVILLVFFLLFYRKLTLFSFCLLIPVYLFFINNSDNRFINFIISISSNDDWLHFIINTSGNRIFSFYSTLVYVYNNFWGGGVGNWQNSSIIAAQLTELNLSKLNYFLVNANGNPTYFRSSGYFFNLLLDLGFALTVLCQFLIFKPFVFKQIDLRVLLLFLITYLFIGSVGVTIPWVVLILILRKLNNDLL